MPCWNQSINHLEAVFQLLGPIHLPLEHMLRIPDCPYLSAAGEAAALSSYDMHRDYSSVQDEQQEVPEDRRLVYHNMDDL